MAGPHVIRLRGPWEYEPLARLVPNADGTQREETHDLPPAGRSEMPADWGATLGVDFRGRVRYIRRFGCPTGLGPRERVWLVFEGADATAVARLNERPLVEICGLGSATRIDVTDLLAQRNLLVVDVELPPLDAAAERAARPGREGLPGGLIGEVRLEIESGGGAR